MEGLLFLSPAREKVQCLFNIRDIANWCMLKRVKISLTTLTLTIRLSLIRYSYLLKLFRSPARFVFLEYFLNVAPGYFKLGFVIVVTCRECADRSITVR